MAEAKISVGVRWVWHTAADIALVNGASEIRPVHFLYGILTLLERSSPNTDASMDANELKRERNDLSALLAEVSMEATKIHGALETKLTRSVQVKHALPTSTVRMTRSAASRILFEWSTRAADGREIHVKHLLAAICASTDPQVVEAMGDGAKRIVMALDRQITAGPSEPSDVLVVQQCDATVMVKTAEPAVADTDQFIALCEMNWHEGTSGSQETMLQNVLDGVMKIIRADRGAILILNRETGAWILKAHSGGCAPIISMTSVQSAVDRKIGMIWRKEGEITQSQANMEEGIYVPILADDEVFGIVCLDSCSKALRFSTADLRIVTALAHQVGLFLAHQEMRKQLTSNMKAMERLLTNFSPKVRTRLVQRVRQGKLQLGGDRALVTIVFVDIRGFTKLASAMDPADVAELLNAYFSALSDCVLRHEGAINDFVGDALIAVFGSPEPDPQHCHHALLTAVEMQDVAMKLTSERLRRSQVSCEIGIGVHSGEVFHGFIGSTECMQYTVVGDIVNFAARYSSGAKAGTIVASPEVYALAWSELQATKVMIPTKHEGEIVGYRIEGLRSK